MTKQTSRKAKEAATTNPTIKKKDVAKVSKPSPPKARKFPEVFGVQPPSGRLRLPQTGDITAAEIITFLPNSLRSHDVVYRFMQNGMDAPTVAKIVNNYRRFSTRTTNRGATPNSLCKLLQKTMREFGYAGWTVNKHKAGDFRLPRNDDQEVWDSNSLILGGFKLNCEDFPEQKGNTRGPIEQVDFVSLAVGVDRFPSEQNGDALNLTRCVRYALDHPDEDLKYPRDFEALTNRLGIRAPTALHRDDAVFLRWKSAKGVTNVGSRNRLTVAQINGMAKPKKAKKAAPSAVMDVDAGEQPAETLDAVQDVAGPVQAGGAQNGLSSSRTPLASHMARQRQAHQDGFFNPPAPISGSPFPLWTDEDFERAMALFSGPILPQQNAHNNWQPMTHTGGYMAQVPVARPSFDAMNYPMVGQGGMNMQSSSPVTLHGSSFSASGTPSTVPSSPPLPQYFGHGPSRLSNSFAPSAPMTVGNSYNGGSLLHGVDNVTFAPPMSYGGPPAYPNINNGFSNETYFGRSAG